MPSTGLLSVPIGLAVTMGAMAAAGTWVLAETTERVAKIETAHEGHVKLSDATSRRYREAILLLDSRVDQRAKDVAEMKTTQKHMQGDLNILKTDIRQVLTIVSGGGEE